MKLPVGKAKSHDEKRFGKGRRFVLRVYALRSVGLLLGAVCVGSVFYELRLPIGLWILMLLEVFIWPHLAFLVSRRARVPYRQEQRNLLVDAAFGGLWVVAMRFNLLPSVLVLVMLSMDNVAGGGWRLLLAGLLAHLLGAALGVAVLGLHVQLYSSMSVIVASVPFLVGYPLALGSVTFVISQQLAQRSRQLEASSRRDGLTGLLNREAWEARLQQEFDACRGQAERSSALLLLDLDHFKAINDNFGHQTGDRALQHFARLLSAAVRVDDAVGRYGGEEFGVILSRARRAEMDAIIGRVFAALETDAREAPMPYRLRTSIGAAVLDASMEDCHAWVHASDVALYQAKQGGRNRAIVFEPS
ncbi:MAG: diguanylate cyclase [Janthinobacterium lividum]